MWSRSNVGLFVEWKVDSRNFVPVLQFLGLNYKHKVILQFRALPKVKKLDLKNEICLQQQYI